MQSGDMRRYSDDLNRIDFVALASATLPHASRSQVRILGGAMYAIMNSGRSVTAHRAGFDLKVHTSLFVCPLLNDSMVTLQRELVSLLNLLFCCNFSERSSLGSNAGVHSYQDRPSPAEIADYITPYSQALIAEMQSRYLNGIHFAKSCEQD